MKNFTKKVNNAELSIIQTLINLNLDVCPKVLTIDAVKNIVIFEKYDYTLADFLSSDECKKTSFDLENIKTQLVMLIKKLHSNEILHGDLHENNIVINLESLQVKLIDFGLSSMFKNVDKRKLSIYNSLYSINPHITNIHELAKWEIQCIDFMFQ